MVDDDEIGGAHAGPGALVKTFSAVAVLARTRRGVGVDGVPHLGTRRRPEIMAQSGSGRFGPLGDPLEFVVIGIPKKCRAISEGVAQARRAQVVRFPDEHGRLEFRVSGERGCRFKKSAALGEVARLELFLQGNRVRGDDQLARGVDRVNEARHEVGERFTDARAGFKEERCVVLHRRGHGAGHGFLLRPMIEGETGLQPAVLREDFRSEGGRVAGGRRR